ncbi:MAG: relaxase/mobilization nuclease domain-containing protein [Treponema sp.]|jgi:hypothetical protein|nr:relaxase/mobilization nuclease domain-containing protein [Treponema sp.]
MGRTVRIDIYRNILKTPKDLLWQKRVYKKDDMREYRKFCRELDKLLYVKKGHDKYSGYHGARAALSPQQNCITKLRIGKDIYTHKRFIKEYLPQENKKDVIEKPALYNNDMVDGQALEQYYKAITGKHFKFIISPESSRVDLPALVKTLVKRMEKISGKSFIWMAATHTDTDHPHAHLLINGADKHGENVHFYKLFITQAMREMARQICTDMIGKRSREEIKASILQGYKGNRYCSFDDAIKEQEEPLDDEIYGSQAQTFNDLLLKWLFHLAELGLAKKKEKAASTFLLEKDWIKKLRAIGRYNSFLKARSELRSTAAVNMTLYAKETGEISGVITKLYKMNDEDSWNHALVVENAALRKAWYVPLYYEPDNALLGAEINCNLKTNQKGLLVSHITVKKWNIQNRHE